jgi:RNA polymerase sigma factor (sigma-70 family)
MAGSTDAQLLERFIGQRDEAAFEELVRRHGPMVLAVCRRLLRDGHLAEDVFQSTFLTLASGAASIRKRESLAGWLHGVAARLACRARADAARRHFHESRQLPPRAFDAQAETSWREFVVVLDEELAEMAPGHRAVVVLCCLQGRTRDEAARELGWSLRTLKRRLEQARRLLHARLARRGLTLAAVLPVSLLPSAANALPPVLLSDTVRAGLRSITQATGAVGPALASGGVRAILHGKWKLVATLILTVGMLAAGMGAFERALPAARPTETGAPAVANAPAKPVPEEKPAAEAPRRVIPAARRSEAAQAAGLHWLVGQQAAGGEWALSSRGTECAGTAFALLALFGAGETHKGKGAAHPYARNVERGLRSLVKAQGPDGNLTSSAPPGGMYTHAIAALALCDAYRRTKDPLLATPAQKAIDYMVGAQSEGGGWRYAPRQEGDTSVTVWHVLALKGGQRAGLRIPAETLTKAMGFLDGVASRDGSQYSYLPRGPSTTTMTAAGQLCRLELGWKPNHAGVARGAAWLLEHPPTAATLHLYHAHFVTLFLERRGGADWRAWQERLRPLLLSEQEKKGGAQPGSWPDTKGTFDKAGGRVMTTALALLILQACARDDAPLPGLVRTERDVKEYWSALAAEDVLQGHLAMRALAAAPRLTVPFLREHLRPATPFDPKRLARLIAELDDDEFGVRNRATTELTKIGEQAEAALRRVLEGKPTLEVRRRVEGLLKRLEQASPERRQAQRAMEVLVRIGTPAARHLLRSLADGPADSWTTHDAREALEGLAEEPAPKR